LKSFLDYDLKSYSVETNIGSDLTILIPKEYKKKIPKVLIKIEKNKEDLGVVNFGISSSTLEDVFLK
jgi:hypothetical protein